MSRQAEVPAAAADPRRLGEIAERALTLWERLERAGEPAEIPAAEARGLLVPWARVYGRGSFQALARRLEWDGIAVGRAAAALRPVTEPAPPPEWTRWLERYRLEAAAAPEGGNADAEAGPPFAELWRPWVEIAGRQLRRLAGEALGELTEEALAGARRQLLEEIAWLSEAAAYELFEELRQKAGGGVYRAFVGACLADPLASLYGAFPVLARQTARRLEQWCGRLAELAERLREDRRELAELFAGGADPGRVVELEAGLSDRHRDGRQVLALGFESGLRLLYKPRSLASELALERLFDWCRERGLAQAPRTARVLSRAGHGWMEHLEPQPLAGRRAAEDYYRRAGALAALAFAFRIEDLTAENLIAAAAGPVIIDAELLFQPLRAGVTAGDEPPGAAPGPDSCLESGLLTQLTPDGGERRDLAGLRATVKSEARRQWSEVNTDRMRGEAAEVRRGPLANALIVDGEPARIEEYAGEVAEGFAAAYRFLLAERPALLADDGPLAGLEETPVRVLFRASQEYGRVLQLAALPRNQRSGLTGGWLHEAMLSVFADSDGRPALWPVAGRERAHLEAGDVPCFHLPAGAVELPLADGGVVAGLFDATGLAAVRGRIGALDEADLERQLALVREALTAERPGPLGGVEAPPAEPAAEAGARYRQIAVRIAGELERRAAPAAAAEAGWELADGRLGRAQFLAGLAAAGCGDRFAGAALELASPLWRAPESVAAGLPSRIGGYSGLGSLIWGLVWLGRLLDEPRALAAAGELAGRIDAPALDADRRLDIDGGAAGAALALLALAQASGEGRWLEAARRCGEHLLDRQEPLGSVGAAWTNPGGLTQTGWAHGAAGIARSLAALAEACGESRFGVAAVAALAWERSRFDAARGNWPVLLVDRRGHRRRHWMVAWCRGAPGIALSRLLLPAGFVDRTVEAERSVALDTTAGAPESELDHLCCGAFGRSSVLLSAAWRLGEPARARAAAELASASLARAAETGRLRLSSDCYENRRVPAGLLHGAAGVGYQLLRLAGADSLPDVLALELPSEAADRRGAEP